MQRWRVSELMRLYDAARAAGLYIFIVRRTVQRLERWEIPAFARLRLMRSGSAAADLRAVAAAFQRGPAVERR